MARPLVILGTGGGALDLLDIVESLNAAAPLWQPAGFLDDTRLAGSTYLGLPVLGPLRAALELGPEVAFINVIGSDRTHRDRPAILATTGLEIDRFATLIHPGASISRRGSIGRGVTINPGVCLAGRVAVGDHVTIGSGAIIGHDATIDDYAIVAPGAIVSGAVHVGRCCYIGAGSSLRQRINVGDGALTGMGAVVVHDVAPGDRVVGCPARSLSARHRFLPLQEPSAL